MPRITCGDMLHNDCPVTIESGDEQYVINQYQMHAKGSHGVDVSADGIRRLMMPEMVKVQTVTKNKVEVNEMSKVVSKPVKKIAKKSKKKKK